MDIEIPLGKRKPLYRFFEILPALISYGAVVLLVVLSLINPALGSIYILVVVITTFVKAIAIAFRTIGGHNDLKGAQAVDWGRRLSDLENPQKAYADNRERTSQEFEFDRHLENLRFIAASEPGYYPKPSQIYNAVIVAMYNEKEDTIIPTIESIVDTTYSNDRLIVLLAYEARGGKETRVLAKELEKRYKDVFFDFISVEHPEDLPDEVIGKGGNITFAGKFLKKYLDKNKIEYRDVVVTTLDSDNRPYKTYFDYVAYEYICHEDRKHLSFQPVSLFVNNIWDAPAPMRVIATSNSFWNIISSKRPHSLRNFASHSQPMDALVEIGFWSTRTIVEDGHQYWRSYFYFGGNYSVVPIHVPIYQDAVLSYSLWKTLKAQFIQLRRWDYGASDVPYVATRVFSKNRNVPLLSGLSKLYRLIDSHVTLAFVAILVTFGGWVPLIINTSSSRSLVAHQLPTVVSWVQTIAVLGIFIMILLSTKLLPKRPKRYKKIRSFYMLLQWVLAPPISILYSSMAAYYSQTRLALGKYMERFDVTEKVTIGAVDKAKAEKKKAADQGDAKN